MAQDITLLINFFLPLGLKIFKIVLYFIGQLLFINRARKKEESAKFEVLVSFFFLFMNIGSILEVVTQLYYPDFYNGSTYLFYSQLSAEALVYFSGFVAIGILTLATERNVNLMSRGLLSIIPFGLSIATLYYGIMVTNYVYFLALVILIVPLLYIYIAAKAPSGLKGKAYCVAVGYLLVFLGEAINYSILKRVWPFDEWLVGLESALGYSIAFIPPLIIIIGLFILFYGYKTK